MSQSTAPMTVRLPVELKERLDRLAEATDRSRSWLTLDAVRTYLELQEWQISEIEAGVRQADAGEFAREGEVDALRRRWLRDAG